MAKIEEHLEEIEGCIEKGQHLDSFAVRPVVKKLRQLLWRYDMLMKMYNARTYEVRQLKKAIRRRNKHIKRLQSNSVECVTELPITRD
jgi:hypothetical protein